MLSVVGFAADGNAFQGECSTMTPRSCQHTHGKPRRVAMRQQPQPSLYQSASSRTTALHAILRGIDEDGKGAVQLRSRSAATREQCRAAGARHRA